MQPLKEDRTVIQLFSDLTHETADLLRQQIDLGKTEVTEKISQAGHGMTYVAIGGAVLYAALLAVLTAAIAGLALVMDLWLSALVVGVVVGLIGAIFLQKGRKDLKGQNLVPRRTTESIRRDTEMVKEHSHGISRRRVHQRQQ
jgi:hypothetical protein